MSPSVSQFPAAAPLPASGGPPGTAGGSGAAQPAPAPPPRWSLHGDLPWRLLLGSVRLCPGWLEPPLLGLGSLLIFLMAGRPRRAVTGNLKTLFPDSGRVRRGFLAWRTFYQFACAAVDGIRFQQGQRVLEWETAGLEHLEAAEAQDRPVMLCTAHMGSYDSAAALFAEKLGRHFFAVRMPERHPRLQQLRSEGLGRLQRGSFTVLYNSRESVLAVELLRAFQRGEWVALQADRALPGLAVLPFEDGRGKTWLLPKGPLVLAAVARTCCLPAFVSRVRRRRYRVTFHPPLYADAEAPPAAVDAAAGTAAAGGTGSGAAGREAAMRNLAAQWTALLEEVVRRDPPQWLVFEAAFAPDGECGGKERRETGPENPD